MNNRRIQNIPAVKSKSKRWKYIGTNTLDALSHERCVTDTDFGWCAIRVSTHCEGESAEEIARAIAEFLNNRFQGVIKG